MIPKYLYPLFWDTNRDEFEPAAYPVYTVGRVLEYGDSSAVAWLRQNFSEAQIKEIIRTERRLSRKSANFWALVYGIAREEVAALREAPDPLTRSA
ncbi:MAG: hypothetical protein HYX72_11535 [Acidobacteria bacterium]|nr:hypothetical protein [Acidobacteriota bacterium]